MQFVLLALHLREETLHSLELSLAAQQNLAGFLGEFAPRHIHRNAKGSRVLAKVGEPGAVFGPVPGIDGSAVQRQSLVGNDEIHVEIDGVAESLAARTGAERVVEAEQPRFGFAAGTMATRTLVGRGESKTRTLRGFFTRNHFENHFAAFAIGDFSGIDDARAILRTHYDPIDQHKHGQREVQIEQRFRSGEFKNPVTLIQPIESRSAQVGQPGFERVGQRRFLRRLRRCPGARLRSLRRFHRFFLPLLVAHGKQGVEPGSLAQGQYRLGHFVDGVAAHQPVAVNAMHRTAARIQQAHVVVDFGGGGYGGSRIARGVLLLDRDGRRESINFIHVRFFDALQKLPRVRRERLNIAALSFGVDGVEGQRTLSGS